MNNNKELQLCRRKCCVGGCDNAQNKTKNVKYYSFPKKNYETNRKNEWIKRIQLS